MRSIAVVPVGWVLCQIAAISATRKRWLDEILLSQLPLRLIDTLWYSKGQLMECMSAYRLLSIHQVAHTGCAKTRSRPRLIRAISRATKISVMVWTCSELLAATPIDIACLVRTR